MKFRDGKYEIVLIILHEVPGVSAELALDVGNESGRAEEGKVFIATQANPEKVIKADEVIHVGMGDQDMIDLEKLSRGKPAEISQIEQQGFPAELELHVNPGVPVRIINQTGTEHNQDPG
jgi:hypothetical protein